MATKDSLSDPLPPHNPPVVTSSDSLTMPSIEPTTAAAIPQGIAQPSIQEPLSLAVTADEYRGPTTTNTNTMTNAEGGGITDSQRNAENAALSSSNTPSATSTSVDNNGIVKRGGMFSVFGGTREKKQDLLPTSSRGSARTSLNEKSSNAEQLPAFSEKENKKKGKKSSKSKKDAESSPSSEDGDGIPRKVLAKPVGLFQLFRYSTRFEIFMDLIGLVLAACAGAAQPLMTLIFGKLTTSFTDFAIAQNTAFLNPSTESQQFLDEASAKLKRISAQDASYLVYIGVGMFVATYCMMTIWQWSGERNSRRIREKYLAAVLRQDIAYFDDLGAGEVATRIQSDQNMVQAGISEKCAMVVQYLATFITGFALAFSQSWRLAFALSSILPVIAVTGVVMQKFMSAHSTSALNEVANGGSLAEEAISSVRTVHAFGMNSVLAKLFDQHIAKARKSALRGALINAIGLCVMFFAIYAAYALAFVFGGILITEGHATSGTVITVFLSILIGSFSMAMLNPELEAIGKARGAAAKIFETIERVPLIDSASEEGLRPDVVHGKIEFENVVFSYPSRPDVPILQEPGLSLTFEAGHTNALVGASGSGKSTIAALILRYYDCLSGRVLLDGRDIRTLNVRWLRQNIGLVSQEPTLFGRSVRANIETGLLGSPLEKLSPDEKMELVKAACIKANAHDFITQLPEGYNTDVGERGMLLSGGQKQRVAIARAIISDPKILILDEATSALDGKSEAVVQDALDKASEGRTTVTVAHRLATIRNSDCIFVMGSGAVLEKGTHNELLANDNGPYAALVSAQALNQEKKVEEDETPDSSDDTPAEQRPELLRRATTNMSGKASSYDLGEREEADESRLGLFYLAKRMYRINREQKYVYISGFVGAIASGAVYPALAILFGQSIAAFAQTDPAEIRKDSQRNGLWYFISAIVSAFAILVQNGSLSNTAEHLTAKLRSLTFRAILRQDIAFFDEEGNATGSLTSNLSDWPQKFNGLAGVTLGAIIQAISTLTIGCIVGLIFGAKLAAIGIACIPLLVTTGYIRLRLVVMKDEANRKAYASTAHLASEAAGAIKTVAALTMEKDCCDVHSAALDPPFRRSIRAAFRNNLLYATSQALAFPVIALVFYVGSRWIADGSFAVASYFTVLNSVVFAAIQAGNVFMFVPDMSKAQSSSTSIIRLSDQVPEIDCDSPAGRVLDDSAVRGHLRMDNIHFRYPSRPAVRVLRGLDLDIPAGWYVALVGPSGCGKSTCIGLLERFYDPLQGVISIDGQPITELNIASYRSQISLVSQEPTLYAGSVRFNILLGANKPSEEVTEEELVNACKDANIYDFIMSLPDGFDTFCGNKGTQLSGGQKQRIAIARALIRNPKILLLDEATSALDSQSERVVQAAIDNVIQNRNLTVVSIAHRLSTVQNANRIYYFHEGRIAEAGTHQQLIAKKGRYYELTQMQTLSKID